MAHVIFRAGSATTNGHRAQIIVDGHDLTRSVLADGFLIDTADPDGSVRVHMTLLADRLEADLPESIVVAEKAEVD